MINRKTILLFLPLIVACIGLGFLITDLKHPQVESEQCRLVGRGLGLNLNQREGIKTLYRHGPDAKNDILLACPTQGEVLINEDVPLPIQPGQPVRLTVKHFRYLPSRYYIALPVVNPQDMAAAKQGH